jgi:hypothetical protein
MRPGGPPSPCSTAPHLHQQLDIGVIALGRAAVHPLVAATGLEVDALRTGGSAVQHNCTTPRSRAIGPQGPSAGACCIAGGGQGLPSAGLPAPVGCLALLGASEPPPLPSSHAPTQHGGLHMAAALTMVALRHASSSKEHQRGLLGPQAGTLRGPPLGRVPGGCQLGLRKSKCRPPGDQRRSRALGGIARRIPGHLTPPMAAHLRECASLNRELRTQSQQRTLYDPEMRRLRSALRSQCVAALLADYRLAQVGCAPPPAASRRQPAAVPWLRPRPPTPQPTYLTH